MKNLKKLFFVVILSVGFTQANAQFHWGIKGGLNVSNVTDNLYPDFSPSAHVGVMMQYLFAENMGIESGLYYSQLGGKDKIKISDIYGSESDDYKISFKSNYLQLPIQFMYCFNVGNDLVFYPSAGIYMGYALNGKIKGIEFREEKGNLMSNDPFKNDWYNKFDIGPSIGLNLRYSKVTFGLAYERGLIKLPKNNDLKSVTQNIKLSVGYFFQ